MKKQINKITASRFRKIAHPRIYREDDLSLSRVKVNIHIRLDADIVRYFKEKAEREGGKYQALINQHLRDTLWSRHNLETRVQHLEERLGMRS
jgi:uncharacterized protein (DUF4415 family)